MRTILQSHPKLRASSTRPTTIDVDDDSDAHARAQEDREEEKKENVQLGSAVVRGLLLKQVSAAALESPEVVANMGIKKIKSGVASGKLRPNFNKASVMRVGRNATVCGIIQCPIEIDMTDDEKDFLGADEGFITIVLQANAKSLLNAVVHDSSKSPMKLIYMHYDATTPNSSSAMGVQRRRAIAVLASRMRRGRSLT